MNTTKNKRLTGNAKRLRREMTVQEKRLWYDFLQKLPCTVNRQKVIGPCIVDFYCASAKLVIELDGSQHFEQKAAFDDQKRDSYLQSLGLTVLRFPNNLIDRDFQAVCDQILTYIDPSLLR